MLIDPDFFDHWRTRMLVDALNDECAPIYVMRIWSHCQLRKADRFTLPPGAVKAICRFPGDANELEAALVGGGWIERDGEDIVVTGWADHNAKLVAAWGNGGLGGRPKKPTDNPPVTHGKPTGNPTVTQQEPTGNPAGGWVSPPVTNKIRGDKTRQDKVKEKSAADAACRPPEKYPDEFESWWKSYPTRPGASRGSKTQSHAEWVKLTPEQRTQLVKATNNLAKSDTFPKDAQRFLRPERGDRGGDPVWVGWIDLEPSRGLSRKNDRNTYGQDAASKAELLERMKNCRKPVEVRNAI